MAQTFSVNPQLLNFDLKKAATKLNNVTGEMSEINRKSRYGQKLAAIHESVLAIRNAAGKTGCAILELSGEKTVQHCALCGKEGMTPSEGNEQIINCPHCGAEINRKQNGAATARIGSDRENRGGSRGMNVLLKRENADIRYCQLAYGQRVRAKSGIFLAGSICYIDEEGLGHHNGLLVVTIPFTRSSVFKGGFLAITTAY